MLQVTFKGVSDCCHKEDNSYSKTYYFDEVDKSKYSYRNNLPDSYDYSKDCIEVVADGFELEIIVKNFRNIPMLSSEKMVWSGDIANFIWKNFESASKSQT